MTSVNFNTSWIKFEYKGKKQRKSVQVGFKFLFTLFSYALCSILPSSHMNIFLDSKLNVFSSFFIKNMVVFSFFNRFYTQKLFFHCFVLVMDETELRWLKSRCFGWNLQAWCKYNQLDFLLVIINITTIYYYHRRYHHRPHS